LPPDLARPRHARGLALGLVEPRRPLPGGEWMNEDPKWKVARLDDFERRGSFIPVREFLGIHSFGMNARLASEDGTLVNEHDESGSGQEEVYVVLDGSATFEVDGETFDAPAGTFVSVQPGVSRK